MFLKDRTAAITVATSGAGPAVEGIPPWAKAALPMGGRRSAP